MRVLSITLAIVCTVFSLPCCGQEALEPIPRDARDIALSALGEKEDPAFDQYVSRDTLIAALSRLDTVQLADCVLQLAHGENILQRQHNSGVTPKNVIEIAAKAVSPLARKEGLARLEIAAKHIGMDELANQFAMAVKMADASRGKSRNLRVVYSKLLPMSAAVMKNIRPYDMPSYIKKTSKGLQIHNKYRFVIWGDLALVINAEFATPANTPGYQTYWSKWGEFFTSNGNKYVTYCSCGSNRSYSSGDHCDDSTRNGQPVCEGACAEGNEGKTCSFTTVMYPPIGSGPAQVVGY